MHYARFPVLERLEARASFVYQHFYQLFYEYTAEYTEADKRCRDLSQTLFAVSDLAINVLAITWIEAWKWGKKKQKEETAKSFCLTGACCHLVFSHTHTHMVCRDPVERGHVYLAAS